MHVRAGGLEPAYEWMRSRDSLSLRSRLARRPAPERGGGRKDQRLDHDRHGAGGLEQRADVDEVEFLEHDSVDRDDRTRQSRLLPAVDPDQAADVAVADEDERKAALEDLRQAGRDAATEGIERIVGERQFRGNDRHVAQRQDRLRRNEDRAAAYLEGVLRRADHGRANSLVGLLDAGSPRLDPRQNGAGELAPEIAEVPNLATVDIFGDAAGERDYVGLALVSQRLETQQRGGFRTEGLSAHGFEQAIGHA